MSSRKGAEAGAGSGEKILEPELPQKRTASNPPNTGIYVYRIKKNLQSPHTVLSRDRSNFRTAGSSGLFLSGTGIRSDTGLDKPDIRPKIQKSKQPDIQLGLSN